MGGVKTKKTKKLSEIQEAKDNASHALLPFYVDVGRFNSTTIVSRR